MALGRRWPRQSEFRIASGDKEEDRTTLIVTGKFSLDRTFDPPPLKPIERLDVMSDLVRLGPSVLLRLPRHLPPLEALLDARVETDSGQFSGLSNVREGCAVFCRTNRCDDRARRLRRPGIVAKVVGIQSDRPRYVALAQPLLLGASRARRESVGQRREAGLVHFVLVEPFRLQCPQCGNTGTVSV
jgi:hypothetical protein